MVVGEEWYSLSRSAPSAVYIFDAWWNMYLDTYVGKHESSFLGGRGGGKEVFSVTAIGLSIAVDYLTLSYHGMARHM